MRTTKQTSKEKEFKEQIKEIIESLKLVNENLKRLYDNDGLLDGRLERLQQTQHTFKEIAVSNEGIKISSKQPLKDLDKILSNPKVKMFFDDCKKNSLIKNLSYIDWWYNQEFEYDLNYEHSLKTYKEINIKNKVKCSGNLLSPE